MNTTLTKGQKIGSYNVQEYLKTYGLNNIESYAVVDDKGREAIMKLIVHGSYCVEFSEDMFDAITENMNFPRLLKTGIETIDGVAYYYVIREKV